MSGMRPVPRPTPVSRPFWDATARGELVYARCRTCKMICAPPESLCPTCHGDGFDWERSRGLGTVYSYTEVYRQPAEGFDVPLVLALVELDEGWHMLTHLTGVDPGGVHGGMRVEAVFEPVDGGITLALFRPAPAVGGE
jgi:uncharacterized protein